MTGDRRLVAALCAAHVLTMVGTFAFAALVPTFIAEWHLSNTEVGWISGAFFGAYAVAVPMLTAWTDRTDARHIYIGGATAAAVASAGFALVADDFWSALLFRAAGGAAMAATFMPGLRVLIDRYGGIRQSRAVAFYTSSFSLGTAVSFQAAGSVAAIWGWPAAFLSSAAAAAGAAAIVAALPPKVPAAPANERRPWFDVRDVIANRAASAFIGGYAVHCLELFGLRSWMVAMLAFAATHGAAGASGWPSPTTVAMVSGLVAMVASVAGNELCVRFGRARTIRGIMIATSSIALVFGFLATADYRLVVAATLLYTAFVQLDSAALTAGTVAAAAAGRQGATMAAHSLAGFAGGFVGPLIIGWTLDLAGGGRSASSWGAAFAVIAVIGLAGPLFLRRRAGGPS